MDTVSYTNPLNTLSLGGARTSNFIPVMLPTGAVTMGAIWPASTGVFVPFFLFACFVFSYLYGIWRSNSSSMRDYEDEAAYSNQHKHINDEDDEQQQLYRTRQQPRSRHAPSNRFFAQPSQLLQQQYAQMRSNAQQQPASTFFSGHGL